MAQEINLSELAQHLEDHPDTPSIHADDYKIIVQKIFDFIVENTVKMGRVELQNLGSFSLGEPRKSGSNFGDGNSIEYRKMQFQLADKMEEFAKTHSEGVNIR